MRTADKSRHRRFKSSFLVADRMKESIISSGLAEGDRLPSEKELAETHGYARGTVREALRILEHEDVITVKSGPNGGIFVRRIGSEAVARSLAFLFHLRDVTVSELITARSELEAACGYLAALNASEDNLKKLEGSVQRMEEAIGDSERQAAENLVFHLEVVKASKNTVLQIILESLQEVMYDPTAHVFYSVDTQKEAVQAHKKILEAIANRDSMVAARRIRKHLSVFLRYVLETKQGELLLKPLARFTPTLSPFSRKRP
ncbi:MAG TPA: FadR/GntR family transcriptional regulator [Methylomirabilota bacterium]|jgi:DNA-binding FadR family transcriptional regulator|nr:FadR/GntR family transcriptional regulator [Methylomirabilota bacterium]